MATKTLNHLRRGERGTIREVCGTPSVCQRLFEFGLLPGVEVELSRVAPLGDPLEIAILGYRLSLRRAQASKIYLTHEDV